MESNTNRAAALTKGVTQQNLESPSSVQDSDSEGSEESKQVSARDRSPV